jgi:hypothetical protein
MGSMANCAIRLSCLAVGMYMPNLHDRGTSNQSTAEEAESHPKRMTGSLIEATTEHYHRV